MQLVIVVVAVASGLFVAYPFTVYPLLLRLAPPVTVTPDETRTTDGREFTLVFCTYNEIENIGAKIDNVNRLLERYARLEILVHDDRSSDGTAEVLGRRLEGRATIIHSDGRRGKAHGMKRLAALSSRPFIVFSDANVLLDLGAIDRLAALFGDPSIGGVCGTLHYTTDLTEDSATSQATGLYWKLEEKIKSAESRTGNVMGADGSLFAIRRQYYPDFPDTVLDDLTVSMSVLFARARLISDPGVVGFEPILHDRGLDSRRRVRIAMRAFHTHLWLRSSIKRLPLSDRWRYWSHRYIRWFAGAFVGALAISVAALTIIYLPVQLSLGIASLILLSVILVRRGNPFATSIWHILESMVLTTWGVVKAARGQVRATWEPPR